MFIAEEWGEEDEELDELEELEFELLGELKGSALQQEAKEIVKDIHNSLKFKKPLAPKKSETFITNQNPNAPPTPRSNRLIPISKDTERGGHIKSKDPPILREIESLNVDIPENRIKVRDHFLKRLEYKGVQMVIEEDVPDFIGRIGKEDLTNSDKSDTDDEDNILKPQQTE